jgi:hypothetical protein
MRDFKKGLCGYFSICCMKFLMDSLQKEIEQASLKDNSLDSLEQLVYTFSIKGLTRQDIYDLFLKYKTDNQNSNDWLKTEDKFGGDHPIDLTLDRLSGWCNQEWVLLPNEPIKTK